MSQFALLGQRRFAPFFGVQALAAFNDNAFRYAVVGMATYQLALAEGALNSYVNLALALFIIPFFVLSATAGQLAEKFDKGRLIRLIKIVEITAMLLAAVGFFTHNLTLLLVVLCLMGVHSTLFGPIKYAILPQTLQAHELTGGNGLVESSTSLAILVGMLCGNALMTLSSHGPLLTSAAVIGIALTGLLTSFGVPRTPPPTPDLRINRNPFGETLRVLGHVRRQRIVVHAVVGICWFWFVGATLTTQAPAYARDWLGGGPGVFNLILTLFSVGVGLGSLSCEKLSGHRVNPRLVPVGALGMALAGLDLYVTQPSPAAAHDQSWWTFLTHAGGWHVAADLVLLGLFAGLYIVPLYALVQQRSEPRYLSRVIAGNNILNSLAMVIAAGVGLLASRVGSAALISAVAGASVLVAAGLCWRVRDFRPRWRKPAGQPDD